MIISFHILLIMGNVSDKRCRENQNRYARFIDFLFYRILPFMSKCEKTWYSQIGHVTVKCCTKRMRFACWITKAHFNFMLCINRLSCFLSFQSALIPSSMNTNKYTKKTILLQTGLSVSSRRRVILSGPLMVSNQHPDASCRKSGVASLSTSLPFLSSKPDYSWEIKEQIFKWCHTHRPNFPLPRFLLLSLLSAANVPVSKD